MSTHSSLARRTAIEAALTAAIMWCVVTAVRWLLGPSPIATTVQPALILIGAMVGLLLWAAIVSPWGRESGGHLNPAISLGFWLLGKFPGREVLPYSAAQLAGSLAGTALARASWGPAVEQVGYAAIRPAPGWSTLAVYTSEIGCLAFAVVMIAVMLERPTLAHWLPAAVGATTALMIAGLGPRAGGSVNPAREFGPVVLAGGHANQLAYFVAPMIGATLGAAAWAAYRRTHPPSPAA